MFLAYAALKKQNLNLDLKFAPKRIRAFVEGVQRMKAQLTCII
jgi:hypothetical protein